MAHAQKPDFIFRRNGRVHLNRPGRHFSSATGSRGVRISGNNAGYIMFRCSVKGTGYPLHSPVSPSLPLPCVTVCHHISTSLYFLAVCKLIGTGVKTVGAKQSLNIDITLQNLWCSSAAPFLPAALCCQLWRLSLIARKCY